jgi:glycerol-3-phosphate cytidylyltransferase-like family protein
VILASGCFDGLSAPQVRYLQACKRLDPHATLVVAIETDDYVVRKKGRYPYWPQADRAHVIYALDLVDDVIVQTADERVPDVIRRLKPRYFVKGPDWRDCIDDAHRAACEETGTQLVFTPNYGKHWSHVR